MTNVAKSHNIRYCIVSKHCSMFYAKIGHQTGGAEGVWRNSKIILL